jgi:uncharacterized membrane protein (UPF0182 family)
MTRSRRSRLIFVVALFALLLPAAVEFYTDWLWFGETGYQGLFLRKLTAQLAIGAVAAALAFGVLFTNMRFALRGFVTRQVVVTTREGPMTMAFDPRRARAVTTLVLTLVAVVMGLYASSQWLTSLMFWHGEPFGESDPVLGRDIGYYVFRLPFLDALSGFLLALVGLSGVAAGAAYLLTGAIARHPGRGIM